MVASVLQAHLVKLEKTDSEESPASPDVKEMKEDPELMEGGVCRDSMATRESVVSSEHWQNLADVVQTGFRDYQVKMVDQDSMEFLDVMVKTTPDQVILSGFMVCCCRFCRTFSISSLTSLPGLREF